MLIYNKNFKNHSKYHYIFSTIVKKKMFKSLNQLKLEYILKDLREKERGKKILPCDEANAEVEHTNHVVQMALSQEQLK